MAKKKKELTIEDCVLEAHSLHLKLQELYSVKAESIIYSSIITVEELIRSLNKQNSK
jgi:hypothetical protein